MHLVLCCAVVRCLVVLLTPIHVQIVYAFSGPQRVQPASAGHGAVRQQEPLTGRWATVQDAVNRLSTSLMLARGDYKAALPVLTSMVETQHSAHWAHADLGWCHFHFGHLEVRHTCQANFADTRMPLHTVL